MLPKMFHILIRSLTFYISFSATLHLCPTANIAYFKYETLQPLLDTWFGENEALYNEGAQLEFREIHPEFSQSLASYELVTFPSDSSAAVIVRGTKTPFDFFADAKLWYSSALFQVFRGAIPFGDAFTPLIRFSVGALSLLETANIKKVAYYPETTKFIEYLKDSGKYNDIVITGHSLGGSLASNTSSFSLSHSSYQHWMALYICNAPIPIRWWRCNNLWRSNSYKGEIVARKHYSSLS